MNLDLRNSETVVVLRGRVVEEYYSSDGAMPIVALFEDGELVREYDYISIDEKEMASFF